ncbi:membrane dipeptidase [Aquiflexum balticum DSM 16537]|uniref:Membrane dipeptidase n=1 Tax=Aquiflexum balticum DSM 16537 TaxID=758820 RepID=A0A1W2GYE7_9BACT|nr:dipeptidase [Aquiflexum balticum]SMD41730.1 membrane dipeptidase [Aquiflexum balticum DSM 16537]
MKRTFYVLIATVILMACNEKSEITDYTLLTDEERLTIAKEIAQNTIMVDGHVDLPYRMKVGGFTLQREILDVSVRTDGGNFDFPRSKEGGLDAPFMSIYIPAIYQERGGAKALADSLILMTERLCDTWPDKFAIATSPDDIKRNTEAGKISFPMGMENGAALEDDINNVKYFYDRGIRYITLTHGKDNLIGDSSYDTTRTHGGLSEYGVQVVKEMNKTGIMVDISHVSDNTFYDVMKTTDVPVIASHSSARAFTPGFERNMDDDMIKALGKNGGVIMINFGGSFIDGDYNERSREVREYLVNWLADNGLSRSDSAAQAYIQKYTAENNPFPNVSKVADHIDHVKALVGIDHIGLGSDFDGVGDSLPTGLKDVSMYPNLIAELLKRGYSKEDIEKICYKNIFRVWNKVIAAAG